MRSDICSRLRLKKPMKKNFNEYTVVYILSIVLCAGFSLLVAASFLQEKKKETLPEEPVVEQETIVPEVEVEPEQEPTVEEVDPIRNDIPMDAELQRLLYKACDETEIPYELALAVIQKETGFRNVTGDGGNSTGYMQVQERWHKARMKRLGVTDLSDPYGNFLVGCDYLSELLRYDLGIEWALMAYNGGPLYASKMVKAGKVSQYAESVLNYMNILKTEEIENGKLDF